MSFSFKLEEVREEILYLEVEEVEEYKVLRYQKLEEERVQFEVSRTAEAIDLKKKISEIEKTTKIWVLYAPKIGSCII